MNPNASSRCPLAGLYLRLSDKDRDKGEDQSESIENQRSLLVQEATRRGFRIVDCYIDDGVTGTRFDRPGFSRMIADIEQGKINIVMTKDLSRFGRNYSQAGYYQEEFFPAHKVRYLAILDGYDSDNEYSTTSAPWMNVANEQYARDTSRKIRGAFRSKMESGQFIGAFAPYGYKKHPQNKNLLIIDEVSAANVRRIFQMILDGRLPSEIADTLNSENVPTPAQYRCITHDGLDIAKYSQRQEWTSGMITKITRNQEYLGHIVHNRQKKASFKSRVYLQNPREEWVINESAHEPIVSQDVFDAVQKRKSSRLRRGNTGFQNIFSGIAVCADCGRTMSATQTRKWAQGVYILACGAYKLYGKKECSNHFIDYRHLSSVVYSEIKKSVDTISDAEWDEIASISKTVLSKTSEEAARADEEIADLEAQMKRIDLVIQRLYEDNLSGKISDARFGTMLASYEDQQNKLSSRLETLKRAGAHQKGRTFLKDARAFASLARSVVLPPVLTREMLHAFVDKIVVHQGHYKTVDGVETKHQQIDIHLKFLGLSRI